MSNSVRPHRRQPTQLPRPWDSPGKNTGVGCHFLLQCMKVKSEKEVAQSCPILCDPMDCSLPGSSSHRIFQARVLDWGAIAFSILHMLDITKSFVRYVICKYIFPTCSLPSNFLSLFHTANIFNLIKCNVAIFFFLSRIMLLLSLLTTTALGPQLLCSERKFSSFRVSGACTARRPLSCSLNLN